MLEQCPFKGYVADFEHVVDHLIDVLTDIFIGWFIRDRHTEDRHNEASTKQYQSTSQQIISTKANTFTIKSTKTNTQTSLNRKIFI